MVYATGSAGTGRRNGYFYQDIDVAIAQEHHGRWLVLILERWGIFKDVEVEQGRRNVIGRGWDLQFAVNDALYRARRVGIGPDYLEAALREAEKNAILFADCPECL
jgi:hypothetical protein